MAALKLAIGNKNYSSWSMRPWLALQRKRHRRSRRPWIPLYTGTRGQGAILDFSRAGKVPVLVDGDVTVWDSLAIIEYIAERYPDTKLWPAEPPPGRMRGRCAPRCIPASWRCATNAA